MSDAAIASIVTGVVTVTSLFVGFLTLYVKIKYGTDKVKDLEDKVDDNTVLTKEGTITAARNANIAVAAANRASDKTDAIAKQLNGTLEEKITTIVRQHTEPILLAIAEHSKQDEQNMREVRQAIDTLIEANKGRK